ncbi:hypothetical protein DERF_014454 [Dermatophagoides farinae]|uniref:Uncharacterized protein n=1 Tax=Dermatophagoides farinae TaxID=6954 RepID=A0A922HMY0_DERFA|nr:hypothetical protein DERF_014454 [Dermatophagoides farinae]
MSKSSVSEFEHEPHVDDADELLLLPLSLAKVIDEDEDDEDDRDLLNFCRYKDCESLCQTTIKKIIL